MPELPTRWIGGLVLGSTLDYPSRLSLLIETPDGTVVRIKGEVEVVPCPTHAVCPPCREGWGHWTPTDGACANCDATEPHYCHPAESPGGTSKTATA